MSIESKSTRKDFLADNAKVAAALAVGGSSIGALLRAGSAGGAVRRRGSRQESSSIVVEIDEGQNALPFQWFNSELKAKTGVTTTIQGLPFVGQYEKIVSELITQSSVYDVLVFPPQMLGDFAGKNFLKVLTDYGDESSLDLADVLPAYREPNSLRNGKLYAAQYDGDVLQVAYRTDLFAKAGIKHPPKTWAEFLAVSKELHKPPHQYGNAFYGQRGFCYAWFINIFAAYGGRWFDSKMNPGIAGDAGVKALELMVELKKYSPPNVLAIGYPQLNEVYLNGSTAMVVQWDDLAMKAEDHSLSKVVGKNAYAPCPQRSYMPYTRVMAISAYSKNPHNAFKAIQFMNSSKVSSRDVYDPKCGEDPFRHSHLNPALVKSHTGTATMPHRQAVSYVNAIKGGLTAGYPELSIPGAPRYLDTLDAQVNRALAGSTSPASALKSAASQWNSITSALGRDNQVKAYADWVASFRKAGIHY